METFNGAYRKFDESIFFPILLEDGIDALSFLEKAKAIRKNITSFITSNEEQGNLNVLSILFQQCVLSRLSDRISLARLDDNVFAQGGARGFMRFIPSKNETLAFLAGRIFQLSNDQDEIELKGSSSGMLVKWND